MNPILQRLYDKINDLCDGNINVLHSSFDSFLFQDINLEKVISLLPQWVACSGVSAESRISKDLYEKYRRNFSHPYLNKFFYYYDMWSLFATVQDRLIAVSYHLQEFYRSVPCELKFKEKNYTSCLVTTGIQQDRTFAALNSVFVALASIFDLLTKIATEQYSFNNYDFLSYRKMKSDGVLFGRSGNKSVNSTLKEPGLLFSSPPCVKKILTFRNEFVHNGSWDMRCGIYETWVDKEPGDILVLAPDMDNNGNFVSSGSRNKFYSQHNYINAQLPQLLMDVLDVIEKTIDYLTELYQKDTIRREDTILTEDCIMALTNYYSNSSKVTEEKQ